MTCSCTSRLLVPSGKLHCPSSVTVSGKALSISSLDELMHVMLSCLNVQATIAQSYIYNSLTQAVQIFHKVICRSCSFLLQQCDALSCNSVGPLVSCLPPGLLPAALLLLCQQSLPLVALLLCWRHRSLCGHQHALLENCACLRLCSFAVITHRL